MLSLQEITPIISDVMSGEIYTPNSHPVSYALTRLESNAQGTACERTLFKLMQLHGIDCELRGGAGNDCDLLVNGIESEVKSSRLGKNTELYTFSKIKPELFKILFFVFIHPDRGLVIKTVKKSDLMLCLASKKPRKDGRGYTLTVASDMTRHDLPMTEWNPTGLVTQ